MRNKRSRVRVSKLFIFIFFFSFLFAIIKLLYVAVSPNVDGKNLTEFAANRNTVKETLYASRGKIYDVRGEVLAQNVNSYTLIAYLSESRTTNANYPQHVVNKEETAKALSEVLHMDYDYALGRLNQKAYQVEFGLYGKNLSENQKREIEALGLPGISFISGIKRYYPNSKAASYIIGYTRRYDNGEINGEMGVEGYYNELLKGTDGSKEYIKDAVGYQIENVYTIDPVSGSDIYLTLDSQIQLILENAVSTLASNNTYTWFTISVMNAKTGAIVGSASSPNFDPNTLSGLKSYVNPLVGYTYEPGSTMKIFSFLAAMENGIYNGDDTFMSGNTKVQGYSIFDFNRVGWGKISYDRGFYYSSNVAATNLGLKLGNEKLTEFYKNVGFGAKTGIELPGEEYGIIKMQRPIELANAAFGQGITTTPIQTLQALSVLTNDGVMLKPYIVDKIVDEKGNVTYEGKRTELGKKVSSESVNKMKELMYGVVYKGLSKSWQPNNVHLAGKTGTAQIAGRNGYLSGASDYIRSFAGIFPYEDPEYIIYASVKQINHEYGLNPVVRSVVENIANYANITDTSTEVDTSKIPKIGNYISSSVDDAKEALISLNLEPIVIGSGSKVINQYPLNNQIVLSGSKVFLLTESDEYEVPNMMSWNSSEVISFCNLIGLKYKFTGYGKVSDYNFLDDAVIDLSKTLEVTLSPE